MHADVFVPCTAFSKILDFWTIIKQDIFTRSKPSLIQRDSYFVKIHASGVVLIVGFIITIYSINDYFKKDCINTSLPNLRDPP